jgi:hypothetical protein
MDDKIRDKIKESHYRKFQRVAPEGFIIIPEVTFEKLKDFEFWKEWRNNPNILFDESVKDTKENFF